MRRILLSIAVSVLVLNDVLMIFGWISQPIDSTFQRRSSLSFQSPMAPMDFIDVEITGHAKESSGSPKRESKIKEEDKARTKEILMPSISPTMTKGKIVEWLVRTGDTIRKGDPIMVIESEKEVQGARGYRMNQDVNSNVDGVLAAIYQQPGQAVDVGAVLGIIVPDFIIDAEIEGQTVAQPEEDKEKSEAEEETVVTTTKMNYGENQTKVEEKPPKEPSLMDEMMPQAQEIPTVNIGGTASDWVHGHHASTDGMANDNSFYSAHKTQAASRVASKKRFDIGIDNTDPFYSPYVGGGGGAGFVAGQGPGPFAPPPPPQNNNYDQPGPSMKPNGANDNFYDAYQDPRDPFQKQRNEWEQTVTNNVAAPNSVANNVANSNMGDYYKAERNGQSYSGGSAEPRPNINNAGGVYGGYDIRPSRPTVINPNPQEVFVKGVSPDAHSTNRVVDPQDGYSSGFVAPTTFSVHTEPVAVERPTTTTTTTTTNNAAAANTAATTATTATTTNVQTSPNTVERDDTTRTTTTATTTTATSAATTTSPSVVVPPTGVNNHTPPSAPSFDQAQVNSMESRIASLEESLRTHAAGQEVKVEDDSFKTSVQAELDSLKTELVGVKQNYDDKVQKLEESYQTSLSQVGRDFTSSMEELRDWDTLTVTWDIKDFEKTLHPNDLTTYTSEEFNVAGYSMTLEMQIFETNNEGSRDVGFYIMHTGGLNYVPIMIGGSKIIIQSSTGNSDGDAIKVFVDDASIEDSHYGWGWKKFFSLQDLKQSFVNAKGEIQVTASVRVKRVKSCRITTAI